MPKAKPQVSGQIEPLAPAENPARADLVIITGMSGSGKQTALKTFEDLGFYAVDNLPLPLLPKFADLTLDLKSRRRAALAIDIREGEALKQFPELYRDLKKQLRCTLLFLDAEDEVLRRRFSETRRPHPLGAESTVLNSLQDERSRLAPIAALADLCIDTSKLNVHELRRIISAKFQEQQDTNKIVIYVNSFGFRHGVPADSDLVFDVRFLPNPNYIPEFKELTGRHPSVARFIRSFPQTMEFINKISELLIYLLPHYIREGKSYLTISFGCTGGQHRSVLIASEIYKRLKKAGFTVKEVHRDVRRNR
ncbi:MAG: RNase adapter RapZ [Acidobacteriaceae bacterium]|nr:RNase adapter RapZ [Acidobacteriaceae bacterium]